MDFFERAQASKKKRKSVLQQGGTKILRGSSSQMDIPTAADFEGLIPGLRTVRQKIKDYMMERDRLKAEETASIGSPFCRSMPGELKKSNSVETMSVSGIQQSLTHYPKSKKQLEKITEETQARPSISREATGLLMKTGTQMLSYNSPVPQEEASPGGGAMMTGFRTPGGLTHQRSSKILELQESIKTMMASAKKDPALKNKLPADAKVPNAAGINELLEKMDQQIDKLDRRVVNEATQQRDQFMEKHLGNMHNFQQNIEGLKELTDSVKNHQKLLEEIEMLRKELEFFKADCTSIDNECYEVNRRLQSLKNKNLELEHESKFYEDQLEYATKNKHNLEREIQNINLKLNQISKENTVLMVQKEGAGGGDESQHGHQISRVSQTSSRQIANLMKISTRPAQETSLFQESSVENIDQARADYYSEVQRQFQDRINKLEGRLLRERRETLAKQKANQQIQVQRHPLQSHFESCLLRVKQRILERKYPSKFRRLMEAHGQKMKEKEGDEGLSQVSMQSHIDAIQEVKFQQFMDSDKREVLELFLKDEEVRWFVYQSLFGHVENDLLQPERK